MNLKSTLYTLLFLTGLTAVLATFFSEIDTIGILIVLLSSVKFLLVALYFMELKKSKCFLENLNSKLPGCFYYHYFCCVVLNPIAK